MLLYDKYKIFTAFENCWERVAYEDFGKVLTDKANAFPCTLGVAGFMANQLRFGFISESIESMRAARALAAMLQSFIPSARTFGKNTSLVVFFNEERDLGVEKYESIFWTLINNTSSLDARPWPGNTPSDPDHALWEFSFAGESIFVVCNTPSHRARRSRSSRNFMITFQPRWVFDGVIGEGAPNSEKIKAEIRRRLAVFDDVAPSPDLGAYGEETNREWKQYFLTENNLPRKHACPFRKPKFNSSPEVVSTTINNMDRIVAELLPPTGSVEIQFDSPFRCHEWHKHPVDETLHILRGEITFEYEGGQVTCKSGDRLLLPAMTPHKSVSGKEGCLYVIATRIVPGISNLLEFEHEQE